MKIKFSYFLLGLARILLSFLTPLAADEAYYLLWAKHVALSYVDHPGMIAWINSGFIFLFHDPLLAIRLASLTLYGGTLWIVYRTALLITGSKKRAHLTTLLFGLVPYNFFIGLTMQVEQPLLLFCACTLYFFIRFIQEEKKRLLYTIAFFSGLGCLSKYTMVLVVIGMLGYLFWNKKTRKHLYSFHFMGALSVFIVTLLPLLIWNYDHHWVSFLFHTHRIGNTHYFEFFFDFIGVQILYGSPVLLWALYKTRKRLWSTESFALLCIGMIFFFTFLILSITTKVWGHWTAAMYIPLCLFVGTTLQESQELEKILKYGVVFNAIVTGVLLVSGPSILIRHSEYQKNSLLAAQLSCLKSTVPLTVFCDFHGTVGQVSYYANLEAHFPINELKTEGLWGAKEFELWNQSEVHQGEDIVFYKTIQKENTKKLDALFETVILQPNLKLTVMEDQLSHGNWYLCRHAKRTVIL